MIKADSFADSTEISQQIEISRLKALKDKKIEQIIQNNVDRTIKIINCQSKNSMIKQDKKQDKKQKQKDKTQMNKYLQRLARSQWKQSVSKNIYQYAKRGRQQFNDNWPIQYLLKIIKNVQEVTPGIKDRLARIRSLPEHDNLVHLCSKGHKQPGEKQPGIYLLSDFLPDSQNLEDTIKNHQQLKLGTFNTIFYQVVRAMVFLQQHGLNHLRLNPSSIIIKLQNSQPNDNPLVRVCDIGICLQKNYHYVYCQHMDYFSGVDPFKKSYNECVKYDLWSLGSIIYYSMKKKQPFYGRTSFINPTLKFKEKHLNDPQKWLRKEGNGIDKGYLLTNLLARCWGLNNEKIFDNWNEVLQYFQVEYSATRIQKMPTNQIFINHVRLIFILSKFYLILREELMYKTNAIWQVKNSENVAKTAQIFNKISQFLLSICYCYHNIQFEKHFKNRCFVLPIQQRNMLKNMKEYIENEKDYLKQNLLAVEQNKSLNETVLKNLQTQFVRFQMLINEQPKNKSDKMKKIEKFLVQLVGCFRKAQEIRKDKQKNTCEFLCVLYQSEVMKTMAINEFGFEIPKRVLLIDQ